MPNGKKILKKLLVTFFPSTLVDVKLHQFLKLVSAAIAQNGKLFFFTWELWPAETRRISFDTEYRFDIGEADEKEPKNAIIIQGPIKRERDYTLETVKLYLEQNPGTDVILSTWQTECLFDFEKLNHPNFHIVISQLPNSSGSHNFNYQQVSTIAAIKKAMELDVNYICKTRTDHRIYAAYFMRTMRIMLENSKKPKRFKGGRIIENSSHVCKFRPYSMSDVFQFARANDIVDLWAAEPDLRNRSASEYQKEKKGNVRLIDYALDYIAEVGLHRKYAQKVAPSLGLSLQDYYTFIVDKFLIMDDQFIQLHMLRHDNRERFRVGDPGYSQPRDLARIDHVTWLRMSEGYYPDINFDVYKVEQR